VTAKVVHEWLTQAHIPMSIQDCEQYQRQGPGSRDGLSDTHDGKAPDAEELELSPKLLTLSHASHASLIVFVAQLVVCTFSSGGHNIIHLKLINGLTAGILSFIHLRRWNVNSVMPPINQSLLTGVVRGR
jgi:hypothetical protein